ncbi:MAG: MgtC/SapB family protein [Intestinibacter sp.]
MLICLVIGGLTGLERERSHQFAGFRTHILVALGACVTSITALQLFVSYSSYTNMDPARLPAQVLSGIGFLGAGAILKNSSGIRGLTTAAGIWATACIGIAVGYGQYVLGISAWVLEMITLLSLKRIDRIFFKNTNCKLYLTISDLDAVKVTFAILKECKVIIRNFDINSKGTQIWTAKYSISYDRRIIVEEVERRIKDVDGVLDFYFYN